MRALRQSSRFGIAPLASTLAQALALALLGAGGLLAQGGQMDLGTEEQIAAGEALYAKYCSQCHGEAGDGQGIATPYVKPEPRDFTSGKYKLRVTPTGGLPTTEDIKRSIRLGLPYSSMPAFPIFTDQQLTQLAYYLKTFSEDFQDPEAYLEPFPIPEPPKMTDASVERGRDLYVENGCVRCHGDLGRGDGSSAPTLVDDWGNNIKVADLTKSWTFRGGSTRRDIYRSMSSGFNGTPMPGFYGTLPEEDIWSIVDYIVSLSEGAQDAPYANLVRAVGTTRDLDLELADELFAEAPEAMLPIVGQVIEPGRNFYPSATAVTVQAVFNQNDIAFRVSWNDMRAEKTGENGPNLEVPLWDDDLAQARGAAEEGDDGGGFWGDAAADEGEGGDDFWGDAAVEEDAGDAGGDDFWGDDAAAEGESADDFWGDDTGAPAVAEVQSDYSDAVALQFPAQKTSGIRKPYFLFGDLENAVHLWFADLANDESRLYEGRGSENVIESEAREPEMVASYDQGRWSVIFKRPRRGPGVPFDEGTFVPIAATVWDGFNEERGNRRGLTSWYNVYIEPMEAPSPLGPMAKAGLGVLALELLIIALVRRNNKKKQEASATA